MDYRLAAARRLMGVDAANARARSVISTLRPVFQFPKGGDAVALVQAAAPGAQPGLAQLAALVGGQIGLLQCVNDQGVPVDLATAWPCAPSDDQRQTRRFVTAGHVLDVFLRTAALHNRAALPPAEMRPGQVLMPDGRIFPIARWVCATQVDLAVFDVQIDNGTCEGLLTGPGPAANTPVVPIGYPLEKQVQLYDAINPQYPGRLFYGAGDWSRGGSGGWEMCYFLHDASTAQGYSGAPVFDAASGRVVGVHVWGSVGGNDLNDAVWLERAKMQVSASGSHWLAEILAGIRDDPPDGAPGMIRLGGRNVAPESLRPFQPTPERDAGIVEDRPDSRDRLYQPGLAAALDRILPDAGGIIGDQGDEGACAAFAVAAAIEHQLARRAGYAAPTDGEFSASVRMLDRMARRHDEWLEDDVDGTSLRAVIKGFYHNGVCPSPDCRYVARQPDFFLTRDIARAAREVTLGSYARVADSVNDMRMAVQEAGAVICTARIHDGWRQPQDGRIAYNPLNPASGGGRHAFVIDGYTEHGFIVQNSRGPGWGGFQGLPGHALWRFEDWSDNCLDAWVIRLAPRSADAFGVSVRLRAGLASPRRIGLLGHMLHAERGGLVEDGTLGLGARGVAETAAHLAGAEARRRYQRLLLVFHEPLLDADQIARLALPLTERLKARGIYPFHIAYGLDELRACRLRLGHDMAEAAARFRAEDGSRDAALLRLLRPWLRAQVADYRSGARAAARGALRDALAVLPLFAGPQRGPQAGPEAGAGPGAGGLALAMLSVGLGAVPALALRDAVPEFRGLPHLALAPPLPVVGARPWLLATRAQAQGDLPGWRGSWADLVAAVHGRSIRRAKGSDAASAPELLAGAQAAAQIADRLQALDPR